VLAKPSPKGKPRPPHLDAVRDHGVAYDAVMEAAAASPPGPSKPGTRASRVRNTWMPSASAASLPLDHEPL
jgi:hypothetical protein